MDDRFTLAMDEAESLIRTGQIEEALEQLRIAHGEYRDLKNDLYSCRIALGQTSK
jgi:hypothetical protein